jgi:nucleoid DNA-binding protein
MTLPLLTSAQLVEEIAEDTGYSKSDVRHFMDSLARAITDHVSDCERVRIGNLVQIEPKLKKAQKKRMGRNPATGEDIEIAAKPASVRVGVRPLAGLKDAMPSVQKLRKRV